MEAIQPILDNVEFQSAAVAILLLAGMVAVAFWTRRAVYMILDFIADRRG